MWHARACCKPPCMHRKQQLLSPHPALLLLLPLLLPTQDGAALCHSRDPAWRPNAQTEDEDGSAECPVSRFAWARLHSHLHCYKCSHVSENLTFNELHQNFPHATCLWWRIMYSTGELPVLTRNCLQVLWPFWEVWWVQVWEAEIEEAETTSGEEIWYSNLILLSKSSYSTWNHIISCIHCHEGLTLNSNAKAMDQHIYSMCYPLDTVVDSNQSVVRCVVPSGH